MLTAKEAGDITKENENKRDPESLELKHILLSIHKSALMGQYLLTHSLTYTKTAAALMDLGYAVTSWAQSTTSGFYHTNVNYYEIRWRKYE